MPVVIVKVPLLRRMASPLPCMAPETHAIVPALSSSPMSATGPSMSVATLEESVTLIELPSEPMVPLLQWNAPIDTLIVPSVNTALPLMVTPARPIPATPVIGVLCGCTAPWMMTESPAEGTPGGDQFVESLHEPPTPFDHVYVVGAAIAAVDAVSHATPTSADARSFGCMETPWCECGAPSH